MKRSSVYAEMTVRSPFWLKRFSHSRRFLTAVRLLAPQFGERILDYGTGDGYLLRVIHSKSPGTTGIGYEPMPEMYRQLLETLEVASGGAIQLVNSLSGLAKVDKIACLEVFEHLLPHDLDAALHNMRELLKPNGLVVVSVPLEVGPSGFLKNMVRMMLRQSEDDATLRNLLMSLCGMKIKRKVYATHYGHMGFDHRDLERCFKVLKWKIVHREFSPLPLTMAVINSQVFYVLKPQ